MTKISARTATHIGVSLAILIAVSGCGKSKTAADYLKSAQTDREAGKIPAAIIDLKNALQLEPKNVAARVLLAESYLDLDQSANAEVELSHASSDGADPKTVILPLARAVLVNGQPEKALAQITPPADSSDALKASLLSVAADADILLGRMDEARDAISAGFKTEPHSLDVYAAEIHYLAARKDFPSARVRLKEAREQAPNDRRWDALEATIGYAAGDFVDAQQAYKRVIAAQPWNLGARRDLARAQLAAGQLKEAEDSLDQVLKVIPNDPNTLYLEALTAFQGKNYIAARSYIQRLAGAARDVPQVLLLSGATSYALQRYEEANSYLQPYVYQRPKDLYARKLLASVQMGLGRPLEAEKTLKQAIDNGADAQTLGLIGVAAANSGDLASADRYLTMAVEKNPSDAALRSELGMTQIAMGQADSGIEQLQNALQQDPTQLSAQSNLFTTYLQKKEFDKALEVAKQMEQSHPNEDVGYNAEALVYIGQGDTKSAQTVLLKVREDHPGDPIALRNLARLALRDGKSDVAIGYYNEIIKGNPQDTRAYLELAQIEDQSGKHDEMEGILRKAIEATPDASAPRIVLARILFLRQQYSQALDILQPVIPSNPRDAAFLEILGKVQLALRQPNAALTTFLTLANVAPQSVAAHKYLADAYGASNNLDSAIAEMQKAVNLDAHDLDAKKGVVKLLIQRGKVDEARPLADELAATFPQDIESFELSGLVAMSQSRFEDARKVYERALSMNDNYADRALLGLAEARAGHTDLAMDGLKAQIAAHPDDLASRMTLGDLYRSSNRISDAEVQYAEVLRQSPNNILAENRVAGSLLRLNQPEKALPYAQHAAELAPNSPDVLDTLGVIQRQNRQSQQSVTTLRKAVALAPNDLETKFHLAEALVDTGNKDEARDILRSVVAANPTLPDKNDLEQAQSLLTSLGG